MFAQSALEKARGLRFFHWELGFPEVFYGTKPGTERSIVRLEDGGFDAVIGNPPWVRQEGLKEMKVALAENFSDIYASEADVYTYFLARGVQVLRPGGGFGMIVQNKWLKAEYAEALRVYLTKRLHLIEAVDFGHAPLFEADTFPCILLLKKPASKEWTPEEDCGISFYDVARGDLAGLNLEEYGKQKRTSVPLRRLQPEGWELLPRGVGDLMEKVRNAGLTLRKYLGERPYRGIVTGLNEAFLIDNEIRDRLVQEDPACQSVIRRFVRGESLERWYSSWEGEWIILLRSSHNWEWPWSQAKSVGSAEAEFRKAYPSLFARMKNLETALRNRQDRGKFWWELRACEYYHRFEESKILYQDLDFHSSFSLDSEGCFSNNTCYFIPSASPAVLTCLNSSLIWWFLGNLTQKGKDGVFRLHTIYMERVPLPRFPEDKAESLSRRVEAVITATRQIREEEARFSRMLGEMVGSDSMPEALEKYWILDESTFLGILRRAKLGRGPLFEKSLSEEFCKSRSIIRPIQREIRGIEIELHHAVFDLYGLTPEEVRLVRETAPPRDPLALAEQELALLEHV